MSNVDLTQFCVSRKRVSSTVPFAAQVERFLLSGRNDRGKQLLWDEALGHAFPYLRRPVHELERAVDGVYRLRNRVAHLEPLTNSSIPAQLANMRTVIGAIDQDLLSWFASVEKIGATLKVRPKP